MGTSYFRHCVLVAMTLLMCMGTIQRSAWAEEPASPSREAAKQTAVENIENYYADLYGQPFKTESDSRLAHLVAILSLSRIDGPSLNKRLLVPLGFTRQDPIVAQVAWEALSARATSLTPEQRKQWLDAGLKAAELVAFPGSTATSLVSALSTQPIDAKQLPSVVKLMIRIAEENDPKTPYGKETLDTAANAVAAWANTDLISRIIKEMNNNTGRNERLAALLANLPNPSTEATQTAWTKWLASARLEAKLPELTAGSQFFSKPEKVDDPYDQKWTKESEPGDLRVNKLDLIFCVDGTGSMQASNEFVTAYVRSVYMALSTISQSTRAGAVYYRHENDPSVMLECCQKAIKYKDMTVKPIAPMADPDALVEAMRAMLPKEGTRISGHGGDGAYYSALETAAKVLGPPKKNASLIIVCIGDAKMTPGSESKIVELCKSLKEKGYITIFLNRDPWNAENLAEASKAASGVEPIVYRDDVKRLKAGGDVYEDFESTAFGEMSLQAIRASIPADYANRAKPLLSTVWKILVAKERAREAKMNMR